MKLNPISSNLAVVTKTSVGMVRGNNEDFHGFSTNLAAIEWCFYDKDSLIQICDTLIDSAYQAGGHDNIM